MPTRGKDKNGSAVSWKTNDVTVMLKWQHHVMSHNSVVRNLWKPFNAVFNLEQEKENLYFCEDGLEKYVPRDNRLSSIANILMLIGDPLSGFFYSTRTPKILSYIITPPLFYRSFTMG